MILIINKNFPKSAIANLEERIANGKMSCVTVRINLGSN